MSERRRSRDEYFERPRDPRLLSGTDRFGRRDQIGTGFDFDRGDNRTATNDKVDFAGGLR